MYRAVHQSVESGRKSFEVNQTTLIDKRRVYEQTLGQFPGSLLASVMGFPRIKLADYAIVTSDDTATAFQTKKAAPIRLVPSASK